MIRDCLVSQELSWLTLFFRFVSFFGDAVYVPVTLVALVALYFLLVKRDKIFALVLVIASLVGHVIKVLLKNYFHVSRPGAFDCRTLTTYIDEYSFPSGHTIFYVIFFGLIAFYYLKNRKEKEGKFVLGLSVLLIALVGFSRVYLGAHWYSDVLAGYLVGGVILTFAILLYNWLSATKKEVREKLRK